MIVGIEGILEAYNTTCAVVKVGGVSLQVYSPTTTLSNLGSIGDKVHLHTQFVLREDSATLYGFASARESELFAMLTGVSGVGPKTALAVLSVLKVEQLCQAIANGNIDILTRAPGLGKKSASRVVLELKGKIGNGGDSAAVQWTPDGGSDVVKALMSLGYSTAEATQAVSSLSVSNELSLEDKIKMALQKLASGEEL